ncbi:hypothetical protein JTB14_024441 [Gonioctena quinquepunctata]|nr:hypothetical protein JTB14_024441 [Gonioctena quinquepunctata]
MNTDDFEKFRQKTETKPKTTTKQNYWTRRKLIHMVSKGCTQSMDVRIQGVARSRNKSQKSYLKEKLGEDEEYVVKELPSQIPQKMLHYWCKVFQQGSDICPQLLAQRGRLQTF